MKIYFDVKNQIITRTDRNQVIANSADYLEAEITFSAEWATMEKTMTFKNGNLLYTYVLVNDKILEENHLNLGVGTWKVSIQGVNEDKKIVTNECNLAVNASGWIGSEALPPESIWNQLLVIIQSLHTEVASTAALRSAVQKYIEDNYDALVKEAVIVDDVRAALDDMAEDGTLSDLLAPLVAAGMPEVVADQISAVVAAQIGGVVANQIGAVVASQITTPVNQAVKDYCDDNFSGWSGALDRGLTQPLMAAPADMVGAINSALSEVQNSIGEYDGDAISVTTITGKNLSTSDGTIVNATYNGISSNIPVTPFTKYCFGLRTSNASAQYSFFDSSNNVISFYCDPTLDGTLTDKTYYVLAPANASYVVLGGGSSLNPSAKPIYLKSVEDELANYDYAVTDISGTIVSGAYIDCRTGTFRTGNGYNRTGYIPVNQIETFTYTGKINNYIGIYGFDEQKRPVTSVLDRITQADSHIFEDEVLTIPDGVYYIIASNKVELAQPEPIIKMSTTLKTEINLVKSEIEKNKTAIDESLITSSISLFHTFAVLGDSFSSGAIYGISGTSNGAHYDMSWGKILGRLKGMDCTNYATPGITTAEWLGVAQDPQHEAFLPTMLADDPWNLYLIMLGINDTKNGDVETDCFVDWTQNADTFAGNYGRVIGNIKAHAPKAKIVCIKPPHGNPYSTQFDLIGEVAEFYGVCCINCFDDPYFMSDYYNNNMSTSHPIGVTYAGMASAIARLVEKAMVTDVNYFKDYEP